MAISTTAKLIHRYQHVGHGGFQEIHMEDTLVAGATQIQMPIKRLLSASASNRDGSVGGIGFVDNGDGTVTVNGTGTAKIALTLRGF